MRNEFNLFIPCPACDSGNSDYFYKSTVNELNESKDICSYCHGMKKVNILFHYKVLKITREDERFRNVEDFIKHKEMFAQSAQKFDKTFSVQ